MKPRPLVVSAAAVLLALAGCASRGVPREPPPLADLEEPPALHEEPADEEARAALPRGCFSGLALGESAATLEELAGGGGGLVVTGIVENSPADLALLAVGDVLLEAAPAGIPGPPVALDHPSTWRKLELDLPPGTSVRVLVDRAGVARTADLVLVPRVRTPPRTPAARFREEERAGVVLRTATEVEARAWDLGPGGGAVIVGLARSSPWRAAGLRFGDLLAAAGGRPVSHPQVVLDAIREAPPDGVLRLAYVRDGARAECDAALSARTSEVRTLFLPPLVDYESERGTSETSLLLGLVKVTDTPAAWEFRLLWFIKFGGGDADKLKEVRE